jgi:hypothetical protein
MNVPLDFLSAAAIEVLSLDNASAYTKLIVQGPGNSAARKLLDKLIPGDLFQPASGIAPARQKAALAGLWLWHDWLDESHSLSQDLPDPTGSFWHAIMHRREGDFSNSKYWYAKTAGHPALTILAGQAPALVNSMPADKQLLKIVARGFDPNALVDLVEQVDHKPHDPSRAAAISLQQLEWRVLFDFCRK